MWNANHSSVKWSTKRYSSDFWAPIIRFRSMAIGYENRIVDGHVAATVIDSIDHCRDWTTSIRTLGKNTDHRGFWTAPLYFSSLWYRSGDLRAVDIVFSKKQGILYLN